MKNYFWILIFPSKCFQQGPCTAFVKMPADLFTVRRYWTWRISFSTFSRTKWNHSRDIWEKNYHLQFTQEMLKPFDFFHRGREDHIPLLSTKCLSVVFGIIKRLDHFLKYKYILATEVLSSGAPIRVRIPM